MLFSGVTGVGKSVITVAALEGLRDRKGVVPFTINFSAQTQAIDTQYLIESKLEKKRKTRWAGEQGGVGAPYELRLDSSVRRCVCCPEGLTDRLVSLHAVHSMQTVPECCS